MAHQYDNEMSGVLFPTKEKRTDKSPDYWGHLQMKGVKYKLAGWKKKNDKGPLLSIKASLPDDFDHGGAAGEDDDDSIPF